MRSKMLEENPEMVKVVWVDSCFIGCGVWLTESELLDSYAGKDELVQTVGYLILQDEDAIVIACSIGLGTETSENTYAGALMIPRKNIVSLENLDVVNPYLPLS